MFLEPKLSSSFPTRRSSDLAVGHIEGGEIVPLPVQADEVDDLAEAQTIPEVAQGAAQQQGQATAQQPLAGAQSPQPGNQQQADAQRHRRQQPALPAPGIGEEAEGCSGIVLQHQVENRDRKSTRLNSSHVAISYAVFCLKKKK